MNEIKLWAQDIALLIIVTGILIKTISSKSERKIMRMVTTLIIIVTVFRINVASVISGLENNIEEDINASCEEVSASLLSELSLMGENEIRQYIKKIIEKYDSAALSQINITETGIEIIISSVNISYSDTVRIKNELQPDFDCDINIKVQGR